MHKEKEESAVEELTISFDAYPPPEIAKRAESVGAVKAQLGLGATLTLAILAGAFIALGAQFYTVVVSDSKLTFGLSRMIGGLAFSLGLILVVVAGAELFTGNALLTMAYASGRISTGRLLRNWSIVFVGNFLGSLATVWLMCQTAQYGFNDGAVGAKAVLIANEKCHLSFGAALSRGILCNALVCLAVWLCLGARGVADKILAIIFPITAFVASGFEHSVANMYFVPMGLALKSHPALLASWQPALGSADLSLLTWRDFLLRNLAPVTLGNIIGGGILVGAIYWFAYAAGGRVQRIFGMRSLPE